MPDPREKPSELVLDHDLIEDGGLGIAGQFMAPIHDPRSLRELQEPSGYAPGCGAP